MRKTFLKINKFSIKPFVLIMAVSLLCITFVACTHAGAYNAGLMNYAINPLTGIEAGEEVAENTRPVAIMVDNTAGAQPQRGTSKADVVFEMRCEDGQSHFMLLFSNPALIPDVGPVYSVRDQFLQLIMPLNAIPVYIGSTLYAENLLNVYSYQDLNGLYVGDTTFFFDNGRKLALQKGNEYCWFTNAERIQNGIGYAQINPISETGNVALFEFAKKEKAPKEVAERIDVRYWSNGSATFAYDSESGKYLKSTAIDAAVQTDEDGTPLAFENVVLLECEITAKPDGYCMEYDLTSGYGSYFTKGGVEKISWIKGAPEEPLLLFDTKNQPLEINTGKTYVGFVGIGSDSFYTVIA